MKVHEVGSTPLRAALRGRNCPTIYGVFMTGRVLASNYAQLKFLSALWLTAIVELSVIAWFYGLAGVS